MKLLKRLFREEEGVTMVEYALMIVGVALIVIVGAQTFGGGLKAFFEKLATALGTYGADLPTE